MNDNATLAQRLLQAAADDNTQEAAALSREWAAAFDREAKAGLLEVLRARPNSMHAAFMNCATLLVMLHCAARACKYIQEAEEDNTHRHTQILNVQSGKALHFLETYKDEEGFETCRRALGDIFLHPEQYAEIVSSALKEMGWDVFER